MSNGEKPVHFGLRPAPAPKWWDLAPVGNPVNIFQHHGIFERGIFEQTQLAKRPVQSFNERLVVRKGVQFDAFRDSLLAALPGAFLMLNEVPIHPPKKRERYKNFLLLWDNGLLECEFYLEDKKLDLCLESTSAEDAQAVAEIFRNATKRPRRERPSAMGEIRALVKSRGELVFSTLGEIEQPFVPDNYTPEVIAGFNTALKQIKAKNPHGRIAIFNGPPGSGKTYLVRALIQKATLGNTVVLLIPQHSLTDLANPEIITCMINLRDETDARMVLILEDCDSILARRMAENMSGITTLLNMGDGLMGDALDIFIVATTNSAVEHLDEAVTRPGRMAVRVEVNKLPEDHAQKVYKRVAKRDTAPAFPNGATLAEIYQKAQEDKA